MSQSPLDVSSATTPEAYLKSWNALGAMITRGRSFSGRERNRCFLNTGASQFADVSAPTGLDLIDDGRGVALVDWDQDGDLDLWLTNRTGPRVRMLRNDVQAGNHFLAVRLRGTRCNRDAIGGRVELHLGGEQPRKLTKSLRAGEGFASQSSKWIHFGLGQATAIDRLVVRWPGSCEAETFTGLLADRRYRIVQDTGRAVVQSPREPKVKLHPSMPKVPPSASRARIVLTSRRRLPQLAFSNFEGKQQQQLSSDAIGPLLINLWASWCRPCLIELDQLAKHESLFRDQGLTIVALCTDELSSESTSDLSAARAFLQRTPLPFVHGVASRQLVRGLTELCNRTVYQQRPLPLPSSFLIDRNGRVAVIYKGSVTSKQLLADLKLIDAPQDEIEKTAFPFAGRGGINLFDISAIGFARAYYEGEYMDDAKRELMQYLKKESLPQEPSARKAQLRRHIRAYQLLARIAYVQRQFGEEVAACRQLMELLPENPQSHVALAIALWHDGRRRDAERHFAEAAGRAPEDAKTFRVLGQACRQLGATAKAVKYLQQAVQLAPDDVVARFNLAVAYGNQGQTAKAVEQYQWILSKHPDSLETANNLAWLYATHGTAEFRNGAEALKLGQRICKKTDYKSPIYLDTLAAAYAEEGRFAEAIATTQKAIGLAHGTGQNELSKQLTVRLDLYKKGLPFRHIGSESVRDAH